MEIAIIVTGIIVSTAASSFASVWVTATKEVPPFFVSAGLAPAGLVQLGLFFAFPDAPSFLRFVLAVSAAVGIPVGLGIVAYTWHTLGGKGLQPRTTPLPVRSSTDTNWD